MSPRPPEPRPATRNAPGGAAAAVPRNPSARKLLYIHVGTHKTGTTAIQVFATQNRGRLKKRGVLYPVAGCPESSARFGHHALPHALSRDPSLLPQWTLLRQEILASQLPVAVISSEEFSRLRKVEQVAPIRDLVGQFDVRVIMYLRRQDQYIQALYATDVLHYAQTDTLDTYLKKRLHSLDYRRLLQPWVEVLGQDAVQVFPYERAQLLNGDIVDDFFSRIGLHSLDGMARARTTLNRSPSPAVVAAVARAKQIGLPRDAIKRIGELARKLYPNGASRQGLLMPSREASIMRRFDACNGEIARNFLQRSDAPLFTETPPDDDEAWLQAGSPTAAPLRVLFQDLLARINREPDVDGPLP